MSNIKQLHCKAVFDSDIEKINPLFSKVKIRIAYTGENRNNSYISKESFEKALPTIYNCPIIGEFIETVDDFGSHGGKIEISDAGIKYIQTTKPYGVINETSEITWEDIVEEDGAVNTYLCATGYLWTGRYEELESVLQNSKSQSMEIEVSKGSFQKINYKDVYVIEDFVFSAFCILGDAVEPCFESSEVMAYTLDKDKFTSEFNEMLAELKQFTNQNQSSFSKEVDNKNNQEGGKEILKKKLELLAKNNLSIEQLDFSIDELSLEELDEKLKEFETDNHTDDENKSVEFSATYRQKREALDNALDPIIVKDDKGNYVEETYFWVADFDDTYVFVEKNHWNKNGYEYTHGRFAYSFDETAVTATITSAFEKMITDVWLTEEEYQKLQEERATVTAEFEKLKAEFEDYKNNYSTPNEEVENLKTFKSETLANQRKEAEETLFEQFSELNGIEEFESLKTNAANFEMDALEKECYVILGKKNAKFSSNKPNRQNKVKIEFSKKQEEPTEEYGGILNKYVKNKEEN